LTIASSKETSMSRIVSGDPRGVRGRARAREIVAENQVEIDKIVAHLVAGLGRQPTGAEQVQAEVIAATVIKSRRLRAKGQDDTGQRRILLKLMTGPFGLAPAPSPGEVQGLTPEQAARCFQPAPAGDEADRTPVVISGSAANG
jgi:hypothetical protein